MRTDDYLWAQRLNAQLKIMTALFGSLSHGPVEEVLAPSTTSSTDPGADRPKMVVDLCTGTGQWCVPSLHCLCLVVAHANILRVVRCDHKNRVMAMAKKYPHVKFRGLDLGASHPPIPSHPIPPFLFISVRRSCLPAFCFCFRPSHPRLGQYHMRPSPVSLLPLFCQLLRFLLPSPCHDHRKFFRGSEFDADADACGDVMARVRGLCAHSSRSPFILILICVSIWMAISIVHL